MEESDVLNGQHPYWEQAFGKNKEMFGDSPSEAAVRAAEIFKSHGQTHILELGAGQGRDTLFFARNGFTVHALEYTKEGVDRIRQKAYNQGVLDRITVTQHDVRQPFPIQNNSFDGCYSHMLYCMALTTSELSSLNDQVRKVLRPSGYNIYTVRHKGDAHYGQGIHRGEDMYEVGGFIVHFFDKAKIEELTYGYQIVDIHEFEEGGLPRRLYQVTLRKN
ncbi:class I SAM-dependent methyltransferase [Alicyclobacillus tolerans]|uniref:Methyltransferase domain-containing protein n=1 Tax=Alicyclobacillus tolerans TaxID=90970 RepID=A0A1M6UV07_9BACL|nr:class I SAM-dependent methyltransferase [Alicyclobacillus montanus]SHK72886.1 Methyltransferase domain-containing protein [Alicyclobacillus montanus]